MTQYALDCICLSTIKTGAVPVQGLLGFDTVSHIPKSNLTDTFPFEGKLPLVSRFPPVSITVPENVYLHIMSVNYSKPYNWGLTFF